MSNKYMTFYDQMLAQLGERRMKGMQTTQMRDVLTTWERVRATRKRRRQMQQASRKANR